MKNPAANQRLFFPFIPAVLPCLLLPFSSMSFIAFFCDLCYVFFHLSCVSLSVHLILHFLCHTSPSSPMCASLLCTRREMRMKSLSQAPARAARETLVVVQHSHSHRHTHAHEYTHSSLPPSLSLHSPAPFSPHSQKRSSH